MKPYSSEFTFGHVREAESSSIADHNGRQLNKMCGCDCIKSGYGVKANKFINQNRNHHPSMGSGSTVQRAEFPVNNCAKSAALTRGVPAGTGRFRIFSPEQSKELIK